MSQGEMEVGEKFSCPQLHPAAMLVKAARTSLTRCGAMRCKAVVDRLMMGLMWELTTSACRCVSASLVLLP